MQKLARGNSGTGTLVDRDLLRVWKIPAVDSDGSKEERGRILVVGGDREIPGAVLLAGVAALRAGAGKLQIATCSSVAIQLGVAVPEALVVGLGETPSGNVRADNAAQLAGMIQKCDAALVGPGMANAAETALLLEKILPVVNDTPLVLDAGALSALAENPGLTASTNTQGIITPHAGEMATLLNIDISKVESKGFEVAAECAQALGLVVVLKGPQTHIVSPDGEYYRYKLGDVGLATSGSGDTLAGIIAGIAARGASLSQAAVWGVYLHGEAGNAIAKKSGRLGYLARELLDEIPPLMNRLSASSG